MGTKNNPGSFDCYANAEPDEPMFVLLARDPHAPHLVQVWAALRSGHHDAAYAALHQACKVEKTSALEKVQEAMNCASQMERWRASKGLDNP